MSSIRNNKQGSGFFLKLGKEIKKGAKETGRYFKKGAQVGKKALFGKRIGDEAISYCLLLELLLVEWVNSIP